MSKLTRKNLYYQQVELLVRVLPIINRYPCFALKGGTAINLYIQDFPRLSVDIDLTYLPLEPRDVALGNIRKALIDIAAEIEKLSAVNNVKHQLDKCKLLVIGGGVQVKVEVSPVLRGHVLPVHQMVICEQAEELFGFAEMQVLHPNEIYAGKICAALDRQHPRDLFDVMVMMDSGGINSEMIDTFLIYLLCSNRPISEMLLPNFIEIEEVFNNQFKGMSLCDVTLQSLQETRRKLVDIIHHQLSDKQKRFILNFKKKTPSWADSVYPEAKKLPGIQWKLRNLSRMDENKHKRCVMELENVLFNREK